MQGTGVKVEEAVGSKVVVEVQPMQPWHGTQAASLLVSTAINNSFAGFPTLARTMYMGRRMNVAPEANGTARFDKNWSLFLSLESIWKVERGSLDLNGEHGWFACIIWRVEASSFDEISQFGVRSPRACERNKVARERRRECML